MLLQSCGISGPANVFRLLWVTRATSTRCSKFISARLVPEVGILTFVLFARADSSPTDKPSELDPTTLPADSLTCEPTAS